MKALTKKTPRTLQAVKAPARPVLKVVRTAEAQCCAKQARTVAGCHD